MCSVCLKNPCDSRCPNAPEPKPMIVCIECGEGIYEGDKYFEGSAGAVCMECLYDKTAEEIIELCGEETSVAERSDW